MSFLNKMMASVGIGSCRVDTELTRDRVRAGEPVEGVVRVRGGKLEQQVDSIYLYLATQYVREVNDNKVRENVTLAKYRVTDTFSLRPGEAREFPFAFPLPEETPATVGHTRVWLRTGLDISMAVDPTDEDHVTVLPHAHAQVVFDALDQMGFRLRQAECEYSRRMGRDFPFVQQFEFVPTAQFRGQLDELEIVMMPHADGVDVYMEVDRRARGFAGLLEEALDADETRMRVEFSRAHLAQGAGGVAQYLTDLIGRHAR